jgi:hypothetical protein
MAGEARLLLQMVARFNLGAGHAQSAPTARPTRAPQALQALEQLARPAPIPLRAEGDAGWKQF